MYTKYLWQRQYDGNDLLDLLAHKDDDLVSGAQFMLQEVQQLKHRNTSVIRSGWNKKLSKVIKQT